MTLKDQELGYLDYLWEHYWVEILIIGFIFWMVIFSIGWTVRRKFHEIKRKRKLQMEKGDQKALNVKMHEEIEQAIR